MTRPHVAQPLLPVPRLSLVAPCLQAGILGFTTKKHLIPNEFRAVRTAASFRVLCGKNLASIHPPLSLLLPTRHSPLATSG